jgi:hypothetical protein
MVYMDPNFCCSFMILRRYHQLESHSHFNALQLKCKNQKIDLPCFVLAKHRKLFVG